MGGTARTGSRSWTLFIAVLVLTTSSSFPSSEAKRQQLEEIGKRQLDSLITSEDYLAVFWRKRFRSSSPAIDLISNFSDIWVVTG